MILVVLEILGITGLFLQIIFRYDPDHGLQLGKKEYWYLGMVSLTIGMLLQWQHIPAGRKGFYGILAAYLLTASMTDIQNKKVYDFQALVGFLGGVIFCFYTKPGWLVLRAFLAFLMIQLLVFRKMYGLGDCIAFTVCAIYMAAAGRDMITYLLHMGAAFLVLLIVQLLRHNVNAQGNLKKPVALLPYISATVWFFLV